MSLKFTLILGSFNRTTYDIQSYSKEGDDYVFHCIQSDNDPSYYGCTNCEIDVRVHQRDVVERINAGHKDGTVYLLPEILFANIKDYAKYSPPELAAKALSQLNQSKTIYFYLGPCKDGKMSQLCGEEQATKEELTSIAPKSITKDNDNDGLLGKLARFKQYVWN